MSGASLSRVYDRCSQVYDRRSGGIERPGLKVLRLSRHIDVQFLGLGATYTLSGALLVRVRARCRHRGLHADQALEGLNVGKGWVRQPDEIVDVAFEAWHRPLLSYAHHLVGDLASADDVVQEAFIALSGTPFVANPRLFLFQVVHRRAIDLLRHRARQRRLIERLSAEWLRVRPLGETYAEADGVALALNEIINRLTPAERAVLLLRDREDFTVIEIASLTITTEAAVRRCLTRARQHLRGLATQAGLFPSTVSVPSAGTL